MDKKEIIAKKAAKYLKDGQLVNLGIGIPTMVVNYLDDDVDVIIQSENGFVGMGPFPEKGKEEKDVVNAGGIPVTILPGGVCFDSCMSFGLIRGGHVDVSILGALEVDEEGSIANWMIPGKKVHGMGGAMDLVVGAETVIITMEHCTKDGKPKILHKCRLPLTAKSKVDYIITELCTFKCTHDGLEIIEITDGVSMKDIVEKTEAKIINSTIGV